jgi:type I restriction enzyme S subunit
MKGGKIIPLEEACNVEYGTRVVQKRDGGSGYPVYGGGGATFEMETFNRQDRLVIARFGMSEQCTRFVEGKFFLNDSGLTVSPKNGLMIQRFLDFHLLALNDDIYSLGKGTAQKNLDVSVFRRIPLFVPDDLREQQRIVALLDEVFAGLATAKANAERNLQNARALFESHLQSVFGHRGEDWANNTKSLSELCELIVDCEHKTAPVQDEGIPSIRTPNIGKGKLLLDGVNRVSEDTYRAWSRRAEPRPGDLILAREAPAGNVAVIPESARVCLGQRTVLIRPKADTFDPFFLAYRLLEPRMREKLIGHSRGATVQHVNMKDIRALVVGPIPPIRTQKEISEAINSVSAEGEHLARLYERKLAALDELKKSLLHKAFNGEL